MGTKPCITVAPFILLVPLCVYQQANKVTLMLIHCFRLLLLVLHAVYQRLTDFYKLSDAQFTVNQYCRDHETMFSGHKVVCY